MENRFREGEEETHHRDGERPSQGLKRRNGEMPKSEVVRW